MTKHKAYREIDNKRRGAGYNRIYWMNHAIIEKLPEEQRPKKKYRFCDECQTEFYVYRITAAKKVKHCSPNCYSRYKAKIARTNGGSLKLTDETRFGINYRCSACSAITKYSMRSLAMRHFITCDTCGASVKYSTNDNIRSSF